MEIIETNWGKIVKWGYNCEEHLRDLRKLNGHFSTHHPNFDEMCKRSDNLVEWCISHIKHLDRIYKENEGVVWTGEAQKNYDWYLTALEVTEQALEDLCVKEYPDGAHHYGYSYCV